MLVCMECESPPEPSFEELCHKLLQCKPATTPRPSTRSTPFLDRPAPKIALISAAAFKLAQKDAQASGVLHIEDIYQEIAATQSRSAQLAEENQKPVQTVEELVPPEYHEFLDVFEKKPAEELPPH